jgi:pyrroline-5-carboxylate reductase
MPNTPLAIGHGYTVWTATPNITESELATVSNMFTALGGSAYFPDEKYLDMATAVSGSGPAFVMLFVEAMIDAAVLIGFKRDMATEMVLQTFAGAVRLAQESGDHPVMLRNAVTSPGGTSAAGLQALERNGVRAAIAEAIVAAHERSRALGG